jgi:valyl-tRNA synthetase
MNGCVMPAGFAPGSVALPLDLWLVGEVSATIAAVEHALEDYRFNDAAGAVYHFVWGTFCDWFVEMAKPTLVGPDGAAKDEVRATAAWALDRILMLLHPFAPFVTEELWGTLGGPRTGMLVEAPWPERGPSFDDAGVEMAWVIRLVSDIRSARAELNVPPGATLDLRVRGAGAETLRRLAAHGDLVRRLARVETIGADGTGETKGAVQIVLDEATFVLPLGHLIDVATESARLRKQIARLEGEIAKIEAKLGDTGFTAKAPEHVIETQRERLEEGRATASRLGAALRQLGA